MKTTEGYELIPMSEITDEAREIAVAWMGCEDKHWIAQKHKLASDIMNYAKKYHAQFKKPEVTNEHYKVKSDEILTKYFMENNYGVREAISEMYLWMRDKLVIFIALLLLASCATTKPDFLPEDQMFITRKYIGDVVRCSEPSRVNGNYITEIKINTGDLLQVYCRKCKFTTGDRLYVRIEDLGDTFANSLVYVVESRSGTYRISQMEYGDKLLVQESF